MVEALANLDVLEILRVGLAGLCFLLSLLAFWLIQREQQRTSAPRKGILRAIHIFMSVNFLTALLVAVAGYLVPQQQVGAMTGELSAKTYLAENLTFLVDLTKWKAEEGGPVEITRSDNILKVSDTRKDYVVPYFTTGDGIRPKFLSHSRQEPEFVPDSPRASAGKHYLYKVSIGEQPKGSTESVETMFTFQNGFQGGANEWWQANVAYPSKIVSVTIRFPDNKPCKKIEVFRVGANSGDKQPIKDNEPLRSNEGTTVMWTGKNIDADTRIEFDWDW